MFFLCCFLHIREVVLFLYIAAVVVNIMHVIIVVVEQAFALVDFVTRECFNIDPFVVLWNS